MIEIPSESYSTIDYYYSTILTIYAFRGPLKANNFSSIHCYNTQTRCFNYIPGGRILPLTIQSIFGEYQIVWQDEKCRNNV